MNNGYRIKTKPSTSVLHAVAGFLIYKGYSYLNRITSSCNWAGCYNFSTHKICKLAKHANKCCTITVPKPSWPLHAYMLLLPSDLYSFVLVFRCPLCFWTRQFEIGTMLLLCFVVHSFYTTFHSNSNYKAVAIFQRCNRATGGVHLCSDPDGSEKY